MSNYAHFDDCGCERCCPRAVQPDARRQKDREFLQGFAVAVAAIAREHGRPSVALNIMRSNGITYRQLKAAGVEEFDLKPLRSK